MLNPVTIAGLILCIAMLVLKYRNRASGKRSAKHPKFRAARVAVSALLVLMVIGFAMRQLDRTSDGTSSDSSLADRLFSLISK
jgi:hypothetical protein